LEPQIFNSIKDKHSEIWEREPLENLAKAGQITAFKHEGFWKCMDTLRDKIELETIWSSGKAPWKIWE